MRNFLWHALYQPFSISKTWHLEKGARLSCDDIYYHISSTCIVISGLWPVQKSWPKRIKPSNIEVSAESIEHCNMVIITETCMAVFSSNSKFTPSSNGADVVEHALKQIISESVHYCRNKCVKMHISSIPWNKKNYGCDTLCLILVRKYMV